MYRHTPSTITTIANISVEGERIPKNTYATVGPACIKKTTYDSMIYDDLTDRLIVKRERLSNEIHCLTYKYHTLYTANFSRGLILAVFVS